MILRAISRGLGARIWRHSRQLYGERSNERRYHYRYTPVYGLKLVFTETANL